MKLGDLHLLDQGQELEQLRHTIASFNRTARDYPRDSKVHAEFSLIARSAPRAIAIENGPESHTYASIEARSNQLARVLLAARVNREELVGVILDDTAMTAVTLLGILKAGAAYLPLDGAAPRARLQSLLDQGKATVLVSEKRYTRLMNQLQWDCPALKTILCTDSPDFRSEPESGGEFMDEGIWDVVGEEMFDDISGGGWKSSYTGEWLSRQVMDEYAGNARAKMSPFLSPSSRVLEIGCSSGITLFQIAPLAGRYFGTDLSARILEKTRLRVSEAGLRNVQLSHFAAHQTVHLPEDRFDAVVLNSVVQCFRGHNYLREVLRQSISKMADRGVIFLGDLSDLDLKASFIEDLVAFQRAHAGMNYRTQVDRSEELFLSREFLEDLRHDLPEIAGVEFSRSLAATPCEMTQYGFDALLRIDKTRQHAPSLPRSRNQLDQHALSAANRDPLPEHAFPASLAYVIYTSGTTGRANGVMVEHRSILRLVKNSDFVPLNSETRMLRTAALGFDASTLEFWGPLLNGGCLCHTPDKAILDARAVRDLIAKHRVNTAWFTATLFNRLTDDDPDVYRGLRYVLIGGEKLSPGHVAKVQQLHPDLIMINGYGPTENVTFTTCHRVDRCGTRDIPIGRPIANTQVFIYDGDELVPPKTKGELCTAGDGLARGYWRDPALTALRFTPDPLGSGQRLYRTGDQALWSDDGTISFLGRNDSQVKVRGYRLELAEIEGRLMSYPGVREAVVIAGGDGPEGRALAAYVTASANINAAALRKHLSGTLPDYMLPASFTTLERLPLTRNGKVDKRALPKLHGKATQDAGPLLGETEKQLAEIWGMVLECDWIQSSSNFFDLGGHSLQVPKLVNLISRRMGIDLPLMTVFKSPTLRALAGSILEQARFGVPEVDQPMVHMSRVASPVNVFAFPPGRGDALGYTGLAGVLAGQTELYGFNFIPRETRLAEYASLIADAQAEGPFLLFGYSAGGRLAYHVAAELERQGKQVSSVIMADSSRYLERVPFSQEEVDRVVTGFIEADDVKCYLGTGLLRDKAVRLIRSYYDYNYRTIDSCVIQAPIHLMLCEGAVTCLQDPHGRPIVSSAAWEQATRASFRMYQGFGAHGDMFNQPYLESNAELLMRIIRAVRGDSA